MLRGRLSFLLLQQCAASQQQLQQCVWAAAACLSTSSATAAAAGAAAAASAAAPQAPAASQDTDAPAATSSQPAAAAATAAPGRQQQQLRAWPFVKQQELLGATFEQLYKDVKQQHALHSAQAESKLLLLITKASNEEQVAAALAAVRANHLKRQRIRQAHPHSTQVFSALLKAGQRAGLGHSFALQLLQQVEQLGLQPSLAMCEAVLASCIKQQDYTSASLAWLYAKAHCISLRGEAARQQQSDGAAAGQEQKQEYWASKHMVRLYARGLAQWLQEGGMGYNHKKRLLGELQALAQELTDRGSKVPQIVELALQEAGVNLAAPAAAAADAAADAPADASADAGGAESSAAAEEEGAAADGKEQAAAAADDAKAPSTA